MVSRRRSDGVPSSGFDTMVSVCRHERVIVTVGRHGILMSTPWG